MHVYISQRLRYTRVAKKLNITTKYDFFSHSFNHGQMHLNLNLVDASAVVFCYDVLTFLVHFFVASGTWLERKPDFNAY